jgi:GT2 family glycosyltransferase
MADGESVAGSATVWSEAETIDDLLHSLLAGTRLPDEIVIVDAGSTDGTYAALQRWAARVPYLRVQGQAGCGRSEGRNLAIAATSARWIAVTDGGVRLDPGWLAALLTPIEQAVNDPSDVVAGFFRMAPLTPFELALGATTLPLAREISPASFLPSSRSVLFSRQAWAAAGGYPAWLDYGEDLVFDLALRRAGARFAWAPQAIAFFRPRRSPTEFFRQYYRYARGDGKALLWPRRHAIRYASYGALLALLVTTARAGRRPLGWAAAVTIAVGAALYLRQPYQRLIQPEDPPVAVGDWRAGLRVLAWLPVLRVTGDLAKMLGYPVGRLWRRQRRGAIPTDPTAPRYRIGGTLSPALSPKRGGEERDGDDSGALGTSCCCDGRDGLPIMRCWLSPKPGGEMPKAERGPSRTPKAERGPHRTVKVERGLFGRARAAQPPPVLRKGWLPAITPAEQCDLSIVIVHRSLPWAMLQDCLSAIERGREGLDCQVILVDQGVSMSLDQALATCYPWVEVIVDRSDRGYAVSNNIGLRRATGRYLLLLNDDVQLPRTALRDLVSWMDAHPCAGYAGPRLVLPDGGLDRACRRAFPTPIVSLCRMSGLARLFPGSRTFGRYNLSFLPVDQTARVDAVVGACMLVRRSAAEQVGLLDETYFMYGEDIDWAYRMHQAGWEGWYLATIVALHFKASSSKRRRLRTTYEFYRAMVIFYRRHYASHVPLVVTWLVLTGILLRGSLAMAMAWLVAPGEAPTR